MFRQDNEGPKKGLLSRADLCGKLQKVRSCYPRAGPGCCPKQTQKQCLCPKRERALPPQALSFRVFEQLLRHSFASFFFGSRAKSFGPSQLPLCNESETFPQVPFAQMPLVRQG
jgi:hypothetical protein